MDTLLIKKDGIGIKAGRYTFYYGAMKTKCPAHGNDCRCEEARWAFVAYENEKEIGRLGNYELKKEGKPMDRFDKSGEVLLAGIIRFGDKYWK